MAYAPLYAWYVSLGRINIKYVQFLAQINPSGRLDKKTWIKLKGDTDSAFVHTLPLYAIHDLHSI